MGCAERSGLIERSILPKQSLAILLYFPFLPLVKSNTISSMKVEVLSRKLVTPSSPTPPHLQNFKLSSIEQLGPLNYAPMIFYYAANEELDHGENHIQERSAELQKSLAEALTLFYPLAGRYDNVNLSVDCNDKGAEYVEARVSGCTLAQLLGRGEIHTELLDHLVAHPSQADKNPLLMVQFNMFKCGGVAISTSVYHKVADGFTSCTFARTWSTVCRIGIKKLDYFPTFPFASFCPPKDELTRVNGFHRLTVDNTTVNRRFVFNGATISKLKALATTSGPGNAGLLKHQPTGVEVVTALVWRILVKISQATHGVIRPAFLSHAINMRRKIGMPIPENSCGCFLSPAIIQFVPEDQEGKMEFHDFVDLVRDGIRSTTTNLAKVSNGDDIFFQVSRERRKHIEAFAKSEVDCYLFSSLCGFPYYEADFGWGKPTWVSSMFIPKGAVLFVDTKDGDGIEIVVGLDGRSMLLFQQILDSLGFSGAPLTLQLESKL